MAQFYRKVCKMTDLMKSVEAPINTKIPALTAGDTVSVHVKIKEGARERVQEFKGTVLFSHNNGNNSTFTVRRVASNGIGVERTFLYRSPRLDKVVVERHNEVRRSRLFFLRNRTGKSARLKQKFD
jgi:large subunit ribosomal protein L19